ncbi:ABC transporter permease [Hydrogenophaga palleronii]|uniref:ABC transporter permease n=1 Tax=Hydrogenophaga palleronii TaxID=65655 RepID=UPI00082510A5|nr:ABC transporter permease [Hydrogenophaga palleronii]
MTTDPRDLPAVAPEEATPAAQRPSTWRLVRANGAVRIGACALALLAFVAVAAPWLGTVDPSAIDPGSINIAPGTRAPFTDLSGEAVDHVFLLGADGFGRDTWSRVAYGARVSLLVGVAVAVLAMLGGGLIGLVAGYFRRLDGVLMRLMDGFMAIPNILLAIALVSMWRASLLTIVVAIAIPEIPRVARLLRSIVLSVREEPYVEAAVALNTPTWKILWRHILPNAVAPLIVHATYVCGSAMLVEAILSFLGIGLSPEIPTWGNIMSEGRVNFNEHPENVLFPGAFLALTVLAVNILGDGLRDTLDPKLRRRGA